MRDEYIAVIDSGIGGLNVLSRLLKKHPNEKFLYFSDSKNAPYGNKNVDELYKIACQNIDYVRLFGVKALVLGCNTLSCNLLDELSEYSRVPTFGVTPPIDYATKHYNKVLLLATVKTAQRYSGEYNIDVVGMKDLAEDIEKNCFNLDSIDFYNHLENRSVGDFVKGKGEYGAVILGCTHYNFIKNKIFDHLKPQAIISSEDFLPLLSYNKENNGKSLVKNKRFSVLFVGGDACRNKKIMCQKWF